MIGHERAAAHDIEEHVGEVVSGRDLIAGSLATICRGYELAQLLRRVSDGGARVFGRVWILGLATAGDDLGLVEIGIGYELPIECLFGLKFDGGTEEICAANATGLRFGRQGFACAEGINFTVGKRNGGVG